MRKCLPVAAALLVAMAAPSFAQDGDRPDLDRLGDSLGSLVRKVQKIVEPLLEKIEQTLVEIREAVEEWIEGVDPESMFGEFDFRQWAEELRRMLDELRPPRDRDGGDEEF